jgi:hypothetical protein
MNHKIKLLVLISGLFISNNSFTQEKNKIHLTTGIGVHNIQGRLKNTFKSTVAFTSGFEKAFAKNWYAQADVNFNSLKYDQQARDESSPYLFQNTASSLFMLGANFGRDFRYGDSPFFTSLYAGSGYLNIGKPRVNLDEVNNIITQTTVRKGGILGKAGGRIGLNTKSSFLQTIYLDGSWLGSSVKTEGENFRSVSIFIGLRMSMGDDNKAVKNQMKTLSKFR